MNKNKIKFLLLLCLSRCVPVYLRVSLLPSSAGSRYVRQPLATPTVPQVDQHQLTRVSLLLRGGGWRRRRGLQQWRRRSAGAASSAAGSTSTTSRAPRSVTRPPILFLLPCNATSIRCRLPWVVTAARAAPAGTRGLLAGVRHLVRRAREAVSPSYHLILY
jgi:hypothetical protein